MSKQEKRQYDLEERTAVFGEKVIELCKKVPKSMVTIAIVSQLVKSGTSVGANYCEANGASSKKDFRNKVFICKKEAMETKYWLRMLTKAEPKVAEECELLWGESQELTLIFSKIAKTAEGV